MYIIPEEEYILVFATHNHAVLLYRRLAKLGCHVELISTPCRLSAGCTQSLKFKENYFNLVKEEIAKSNVITRGIYKVCSRGNKINYVPV
jgi:hypothetical protein